MLTSMGFPAFAATNVTISLTKSDQSIPETTTLLSSGVVKSGIPTYRVMVKATITGGSSGIVGRKLTFNNPNSTTVKLVTSTAIQSSGTSYTAYATYEVRGATAFTCSASINDGTFSGSTSTSITPSVACGYYKSMYITYYIIAKESQYTGTRNTSATGITGLYKSAFLQDVKMQGSGYTEDSKYIQYYQETPGVWKFKFVTSPQTATLTTPTVGKTIAVDPEYIPRLTTQRAKVTIGGGVGARQAEDGGGAIKQWHIDVFYGTGKPSSPPSWSTTYQSVYYNGNNLY